ncbi:hypothetical protein [Streptomyces albipurpureus]|uniref:ABC transporter n=1 Tax=Streptomyces albipurpureus TaxID=2897419 RepID=A0ABT0UKD5_9ACTN|nr:hypothetical protein [Streptomyces sp. CWNU-1]MCM2388920.1 hypothetical protein [Streptomyces sp. CWNU-1]
MRSPLILQTALLPYLFRMAPHLPVAVGGGTALVVCALPLILAKSLELGEATLLLRMASVLCAVPLALALDDPAHRTTATLPFSLTVRRLLRLALALLPLATIWAVCGALLSAVLNPGNLVGLPLAGLSLEAATLAVVAVLLSALGLRLSKGERGSTVAAPGSVLLPLFLVLSPARSDLFATPYTQAWASSRWIWAVLLAAAASSAAALLRERRLTTQRVSATRHAPHPTPSPSGDHHEAKHP